MRTFNIGHINWNGALRMDKLKCPSEVEMTEVNDQYQPDGGFEKK